MKKILLSVGILGLAVLGLATTKVEAAEVLQDGVRYHQVEANDTLSKISQDYGVSLEDLYSANQNEISDIHLIFQDQMLIIPDGKVSTVVTLPETNTVAQEPVQEAAPVIEFAPVVEQAPVAQAPVTGNSSSAKEWIAQRESGGSYTASNGQYYGKYQLNPSLYTGYDTTPAGQEAAADAYVAGRYGSWEAAQSFWIANGWY